MDLVVVVPYLIGALAKIADGSLKAMGGDLYKRAVAFVDRLRGATENSPQEAKTLRSFNALPEDYRDEMRLLLERHLRENGALREAASALLEDPGAPTLLLRVDADKAGKLMGVEDLEIARGRADISVHAREADEATGAKKIRLS